MNKSSHQLLALVWVSLWFFRLIPSKNAMLMNMNSSKSPIQPLVESDEKKNQLHI